MLHLGVRGHFIGWLGRLLGVAQIQSGGQPVNPSPTLRDSLSPWSGWGPVRNYSELLRAAPLCTTHVHNAKAMHYFKRRQDEDGTMC